MININTLDPDVRKVFLISTIATDTYDIYAGQLLEKMIRTGERFIYKRSNWKLIKAILTTLIFLVLAAGFPFLFCFSGPSKGVMRVIVAGIVLVVLFCTFGAYSDTVDTEKRFKKSMNTLIDSAANLSEQQQQELFAAMYQVGLQVRENKKLASTIAYMARYD
ncbi:hypothetical protein [Geomonas edaphica]|uniref:hypothetical protein n=1 Tax=Geomonas edaphica TaxID=2570226 RepID=UPI0010A79F2D|nr:hypothetical protein [Geomonas edaphica]